MTARLADPHHATARDEEALRDTIASGEAILLTGAGFSCNTLSRAGRAVPLGEQLADALFALCFPGEARDDSSLADLFEHALQHHYPALCELLASELAIDPRSIGPVHAAWFGAPWRRVYTLNVDDLARVTSERFGLPKRVRELSALRDPVCAVGDTLDVVKLNGCVRDGPDGVTFATTQYGARLATRSAWYEALLEDMKRHPFVVVGSRLDEPPLWQHARRAGLEDDRPRSWIITPTLTRARRSLLEAFGFGWIPATADEVATLVLPSPRWDPPRLSAARPSPSARRGRARSCRSS